MIQIPISTGELIDKLSILQVKKNKITNSEKLAYIDLEFEILYKESLEYLKLDLIWMLYNELIHVNTDLWEIEDELRLIENTKIFEDRFIHLARQVYYTNDNRFKLKDEINKLTNSEIKEQKDYTEYK